MARRRGKSGGGGGGGKQDDSLLLLEPPAGQPRAINEYVLPLILVLIIAVGGSALGWFCSQQQAAIDSLSETLTSLQTRITKLQQQLGTGNAQLVNVGGFEERLVALEEAYAKAQKQVEVALATSEQIKSKDLHSKVWALQTELNSKLAELQQNSLSTTALNVILKNKSDEIEAVKQSVSTILSANSELSISISGLSDTLTVTKSRLDDQVSVVDDLVAQLKGQQRDIAEVKELSVTNHEEIAATAQDLTDVRDLLEIEQVKRTQAFEEQLRTLHKSLEEHQASAESLHSHRTAQLEVQTQVLPGGQEPVTEEDEVEVDEATATAVNQPQEPKEEPEHTEELEFTADQQVRVEEEFSEAETKVQEEDISEESRATEEEFTEKPEATEEELIEEPVAKNEVLTKKQDEHDEERMTNTRGVPEEDEINKEKASKKKKKFTKEYAAPEDVEVTEQHVEEQVTEKELGPETNITEENAEEEEEEKEEDEKEKAVSVAEKNLIPIEESDKITNENEEHLKETVAEKVQTPLEDSELVTAKKEERVTEGEMTVAQDFQNLLGMTDGETEETRNDESVEESVVEEMQTLSDEKQENHPEEQALDEGVEEDSGHLHESDLATNETEAIAESPEQQTERIVETEEEEHGGVELTEVSSKEITVLEETEKDVQDAEEAKENIEKKAVTTLDG